MKLNNQIIKRISSLIFPTKPIPKKEYVGDVFMLGGKEGDEFLKFKPLHFTAGAVTGDIGRKGKTVIFYAQIIGVEDVRAPIRNWGMNLKQFTKHYLHSPLKKYD